MKTSIRRTITVLTLALATSSFGIPILQLDIGGGTYVGGTEESTVATSDSFNLYAILQPAGTSTTSGLYRISAALYPKTAKTDPPPSLGTISFNGSSYSVTESMYWGTPPEELLANTDAVGKELPTHDIFATYFLEFDVLFDASKQCAGYNVATTLGVAGTPEGSAGTGCYYQDFAVDVSGLNDGYGIHFDLYQVNATMHTTKGNGKKSVTQTLFTTDMIEKAPFSHDAGSTTTRVPDAGTTVSLLSASLLAMAGLRRFRS